MPAEILNRLESILPEIKASVANRSTSPPMETEPLKKLRAEMRAMTFILNLPIISIEHLYGDELLCGLCDKKYDDTFKVCSRGESPCCLPCGHIAGHQCLRANLSPYESGFTKCPFANCNVDFPQMFTDAAEPVRPTSGIAKGSVGDHELSDKESSDEELTRQISQLSNDSGVSQDEIKRYLSIDEVLNRIRSEEVEEKDMGTEVRDFATEAAEPPEIGEGEFPRDRRMAMGPSFARAAEDALSMIAKNF